MTEQEQQSLLKFAQGALADWPEGGLDGYELQDLAIECGLLQGQEVTEPCGTDCRCEEWGDFPATCYHRAKFLQTDKLSLFCVCVGLFLFLLFPGFALAKKAPAPPVILTCVVERVLDGDTVDCTPPGGSKVRVRLAEIDAPEKKQAYGPEAKEFLEKLIQGKKVEIEVKKKDLYGRSIGNIVQNGQKINASMVENGFAWVYMASKKDSPQRALEGSARASKKGLWQEVNPVPPWEWRKQQKK